MIKVVVFTITLTVLNWVMVSKSKSGSEHLGYFKTEIEAFNAYKQAKESFIKEQAEKWKDKIDPRAYEALINYTVEITD